MCQENYCFAILVFYRGTNSGIARKYTKSIEYQTTA